MSSMKFIHEGDTKEMTRLFSNATHNDLRIKNVQRQGTKTVYTVDPKSSLSHDTYLPAGIFVPAYGRLMLYEQLDKLGDRVLYHDTDSIIYIYDPRKENIPEGDIWGEWDEEKVSKNGNISAFLGMGAKSYALKTKNGEDVIKLKGLSVKLAHQITFEMLEALVQQRGETAIPQRNFVYKLGEGIHITERLKKLAFDPSSLKGYLHTDDKIYPPGYCQDCLTGHEHNI